jgi:hypothetical protein
MTQSRSSRGGSSPIIVCTTAQRVSARIMVETATRGLLGVSALACTSVQIAAECLPDPAQGRQEQQQ